MLFRCTIILMWCWLAAGKAPQLEANTRSFEYAASDTPFPKQPGHRIPVPSLYHQRYSEQTFIGTHDSVAIRTEDNNWSLSGNQYFNISTQLGKQIEWVKGTSNYVAATYSLIFALLTLFSMQI